MRINQPEIYDPKKEYKVGERFVYKDNVLFVDTWTNSMTEIAIKYEMLEFAHKCGCCKVERKDCFGVNGKCWSFERKDRKNVYYRFKSKFK